MLNQIKRLLSSKPTASPYNNTSAIKPVYDQREDLFFISTNDFHQRVYLSDERRSELYANGIIERLKWLLSDYRINDDLIREKDLVVDIGANIGELGIFCSMRKADYIAIEPDPSAFRALSLNNREAVLLNYALSSHESEQTFYLATSTADSSLYKPQEYTEAIKVMVKTLDQCIHENWPDRSIRLLKIEAEGMEPEILLGSKRTLKRTQYIAIDAGPEREGVSTAPECLNFLVKAGFDIIDTYLLRGTFLLRNTTIDIS